MDASYNGFKELAALQSISISNGLYGNEVTSSFEMTKVCTKPLERNNMKTVPDDAIEAHNKLQARRKLRLILKSRATIQDHIVVGDIIEVYNKTGMNKRGVWSTPKILWGNNYDARTFMVPRKQEKRAVVAAEYCRLAVPEESFASMIKIAMDRLDEGIENLVLDENEEHMKDTGDDIRRVETQNAELSDLSVASNINNDTTTLAAELDRGYRFMVYWPIDKRYYAGTTNNIHRDGNVTVLYDDGAKERLNTDNKKLRYESLHVSSGQTIVE